jgi:hypothetical protein
MLLAYPTRLAPPMPPSSGKSYRAGEPFEFPAIRPSASGQALLLVNGASAHAVSLVPGIGFGQVMFTVPCLMGRGDRFEVAALRADPTQPWVAVPAAERSGGWFAGN